MVVCYRRTPAFCGRYSESVAYENVVGVWVAMTGVTPAKALFAERAASAIRIGFIGYLSKDTPSITNCIAATVFRQRGSKACDPDSRKNHNSVYTGLRICPLIREPVNQTNAMHEERAQEQRRGRGATAPWEIPWRGWKEVLSRTYHETLNDRLFYVAAGVAFFVLLAIFPAISALVSCYALIANPGTITDQISVLQEIIPRGTYGILTDQVQRIIQRSTGSLSLTFLLSLVFALWSANSGVKAIIDALNVVYEQTDQRSFIRLTIISLAMTIGGIAVLIVSAAAFIVFPLVMSFIGFGALTGTVTAVLRWPLLFFLIFATLVFLYRHGPYSAPARFAWISVGGVFATITWLGTSALLSWYLSNVSNYDVTYGSLGAVVGMMIWLWVTFVVVLVGAELNAELEHQTSEIQQREARTRI